MVLKLDFWRVLFGPVQNEDEKRYFEEGEFVERVESEYTKYFVFSGVLSLILIMLAFSFRSTALHYVNLLPSFITVRFGIALFTGWLRYGDLGHWPEKRNVVGIVTLVVSLYFLYVGLPACVRIMEWIAFVR